MAQIHKKLTNSHCIIIACKYIRTYMFYSVFSKQEIKLVFKLYAVCLQLITAVCLQLFPLFNYINGMKQDLEIKSRVNFPPE